MNIHSALRYAFSLMKGLLAISFLFLLISVSWSCNKTDEQPEMTFDYLLFGHYYGECFGEACIESYKLTTDSLYEDTLDNYGATELLFVPLANDLFEQVEDLPDFLPTDLLDEPDGTFGCPDCADQGGLLIRYAADGQVSTWRLDQDQSAVPSYLHAFMDKVNEKITLINE